MKIKYIKTGMAVHCINDSEINGLNLSPVYGEAPCYIYVGESHGKVIFDGWNKENTRIGYEEVEFSDIQEEEMSTEEVLKIISEIYSCSDRNCAGCIMYGFLENYGAPKCAEIGDFQGKEDKLVEICRKWKSDHEKKEPEVEWVWQAIDGNSHMKMEIFEKEEDAIRYCEDMIKEKGIGNEFRYQKICRVKGGVNE